jgi:hypothetical protein
MEICRRRALALAEDSRVGQGQEILPADRVALDPAQASAQGRASGPVSARCHPAAADPRAVTCRTSLICRPLAADSRVRADRRRGPLAPELELRVAPWRAARLPRS